MNLTWGQLLTTPMGLIHIALLVLGLIGGGVRLKRVNLEFNEKRRSKPRSRR